MKHRLNQRVLQSSHNCTQTGKTPLEVSQSERGKAPSRVHFSQADPGEREWIEEMWGQGHSLLSLFRCQRASLPNVSGASNVTKTKTSLKVSVRCRKVKQLCEAQLEGVYWLFQPRFLFKADLSTTKKSGFLSRKICLLNANVKILESGFMMQYRSPWKKPSMLNRGDRNKKKQRKWKFYWFYKNLCLNLAASRLSI